MIEQSFEAGIIDLVAEVVSAYVAHNTAPVGELPALIRDVHRAFLRAAAPALAEPPAPEQHRASAQEIRRSITPEHLISFEDGKSYKALRRHLTTRGLTPEAYRAKWGLPADYPMASPNYSKQRSELALALGLGRKPGSGLTKLPPEAALKVEAFEEVAMSAVGEVPEEAVALAEAAAPATEPAAKPKRAAAPRTRKVRNDPVAS